MQKLIIKLHFDPTKLDLKFNHVRAPVQCRHVMSESSMAWLSIRMLGYSLRSSYRGSRVTPNVVVSKGSRWASRTCYQNTKSKHGRDNKKVRLKSVFDLIVYDHAIDSILIILLNSKQIVY